MKSRITIAAALAIIASAATHSAVRPAAAPFRVGYLSGSLEYTSEASLKAFAAEMETKHGLESRHFACKDIAEGSSQQNPTSIPNLASLDSVDVLVVYSRRCWLMDAQYRKFRDFLDLGRGLVGLRTASHALQNWSAGRGIDSAIWGGAYNNHGGSSGYALEATAAGKAHPILKDVGEWRPDYWLYYQNLPSRAMAADAVVLLHGSNADGRHPVAWTRAHKGGNVFYTSTGVPKDFEKAAFKAMLTNALFWAAKETPTAIAPRVGAARPRRTAGAGLVPGLLILEGAGGVLRLRPDGRPAPSLPPAIPFGEP